MTMYGQRTWAHRAALLIPRPPPLRGLRVSMTLCSVDRGRLTHRNKMPEQMSPLIDQNILDAPFLSS